MIDPLANLTEIKRNVQKEIELQFEVKLSAKFCS